MPEVALCFLRSPLLIECRLENGKQGEILGSPCSTLDRNQRGRTQHSDLTAVELDGPTERQQVFERLVIVDGAQAVEVAMVGREQDVTRT